MNRHERDENYVPGHYEHIWNGTKPERILFAIFMVPLLALAWKCSGPLAAQYKDKAAIEAASVQE